MKRRCTWSPWLVSANRADKSRIYHGIGRLKRLIVMQPEVNIETTQPAAQKQERNVQYDVPTSIVDRFCS